MQTLQTPKNTHYQEIEIALKSYQEAKEEQTKSKHLETLLTMLRPLIIASCKHYFGIIEEDRIQDGYEKSIRLINNFNKDLTNIKFLGYMKRMIMCYYWDQKKIQLKRQQLESLEKENLETITPNKTYISTLSYQEKGYQTIEINDLLSILKEKEKQIIIKTYLQNKKQKQVAEEMGISLAYTKELLQNARKKLREVTSI